MVPTIGALGVALTPKFTVLLQPVAVSVKVSTTKFEETPVTKPALVTVATAVLVLDHVPPEAGVTLVV